MNKEKLSDVVLSIKSALPPDMDGSQRADMFVYLAIELGLDHLLAPEVLPPEKKAFFLPDTAPELYRERKDKSEKPANFIGRVYADWHGQGLARHHLLKLDEPLYHALCCWLIKNEMPEWLDLPTKKEINDRDLNQIGINKGQRLPYPSYYDGLKRELRLYNAARNRSDD
ncbi:MAG: hypothetical protein JJ891_16155 [Rhizobiaceae bacterium]|jgi:hypothetical protein|nr:hypothetical protein [Rhizobiaceae bacterium]